MVAQPGTPAAMNPRGEDWIARKFEEMGRANKEDIASIAKSFQSTVADLEEQQDAILALINAQLGADADYVNAGALSLTTSEVTIATKTLTIPTGFTKAIVVGIGSIGITSPLGTASSFAGRVYIEHPIWGSTWGPRWFQNAPASADSAVYPNHQAYITGVAAGSVITVRMICMNGGGSNWGATPGGGTLNVHAFYLR